MHSFFLRTAIAALTATALATGATAQPKTYTFAVVPQQSATKLARLWTPILAHLGKTSGIALRFKTAPDIPEFEKRLADGQYDFAYMNPYHYTVFRRSPGYVAIARETDKRLKGIIVVRKDSPVTAIEQLAGETLAFPAPAAFAASVLPRANFENSGIPITPKYVSSHDSVYRSVAKGLYSAGGGVERTFNNVAADVRAQLRVLWTTEGYTPHAFAAHPAAPIGVAFELQSAMVGMAGDPVGRGLLESVKFKGIQAAQDADWDDVRKLGITLLESLVEE